MSQQSEALSFARFVDTIDDGQLGDEIMERLRDVVSRVRDTGRKGKVKLSLDVSMAGAKQIEIQPTIKSKEPKTQHGQRLFYSDGEGHLYRRDPDQMDLPLRSPEGADAKTRQSVENN